MLHAFWVFLKTPISGPILHENLGVGEVDHVSSQTVFQSHFILLKMPVGAVHRLTSYMMPFNCRVKEDCTDKDFYQYDHGNISGS